MSGTLMETPLPTSRLAWLRERGMGASVLVATLSAAFGVTLVETTVFIGAVLKADPLIGDSGTLAVVVAILSVLLTAVAMYVAAIVTANTFSTIVAGRTRQIALLRLIGATARSQRLQVGQQGLTVGVLGATAGLLIGLGLSAAGVAISGPFIANPPVGFTLAQPLIIVPVVGVALTTWLASWVGSRRVLTVTPLQALGGSVELSREEVAAGRGRHAVAGVLLGLGTLLLAAGVVLGLMSPLGVVVAFVGGLFSFTGLTLGASLVMPPVLRAVGRMFGSSATARLAAENAMRFSERSSRMAIGVVMRRRELGLLRAIGLTGGQVRAMVLFEAAHITIAATLTGLVLGVVYGWVGAQSLLGSVPTLPDMEPAGFVAPYVPWLPMVIIVLATAALTLVAAATPTRLATRVTPVEALAAE